MNAHLRRFGINIEEINFRVEGGKIQYKNESGDVDKPFPVDDANDVILACIYKYGSV